MYNVSLQNYRLGIRYHHRNVGEVLYLDMNVARYCIAGSFQGIYFTFQELSFLLAHVFFFKFQATVYYCTYCTVST